MQALVVYTPGSAGVALGWIPDRSEPLDADLPLIDFCPKVLRLGAIDAYLGADVRKSLEQLQK